MRSGDIDLLFVAGCLRYMGNAGNAWSSFVASNIWNNTGSGAYHFALNATDSVPSYGPNYQWLGVPLRYLPILYTSLLSTLYFVRSGGIDIELRPFMNLGIAGYEWPASTRDTATAYYFAFNEYNVLTSGGPTNTYRRLIGYPLRCLSYSLSDFSVSA